MEWLERFQQKFGLWYQSALGVTEETELTPKDVMRKILDAMEEFRSEGLDGRIYVPNKYILELAVMNPDERAYLLSFLDEEELGTVLERYMAHKNYFTRGPLDFTIEELEAFPGEDKLVVRALFDKSPARPLSSSAMPSAAKIAEEHDPISEGPDDSLTVEAIASGTANDDDDLPTVHSHPTAWAALMVGSPDGNRSLVSITTPIFTIGRSRHGGNDLVLANDGQVSKRHLRIELEPDGGATAYDLASTNGTYINGKLVPVNASLRHGDLIEIGQTQMEFQKGVEAANAAVAAKPAAASPDPTIPPKDESGPAIPPPAPKAPRLRRLSDNTEYVLGSEALVGRGMTCDIVLSEPSVSTQQARITSDHAAYHVQDLSGRGTTIVNGRPTRTGERFLLSPGDRISLGGVAFVFDIS